jgi:hypothetical protein
MQCMPRNRASTCQSARNCLQHSHADRHSFAPAQRRHVNSPVRETADTDTRPALPGPMLYRQRYLRFNVRLAKIP